MPIPAAPQLVQIMKVRNGVAPICLLDILTGDGQAFYWGQQQMLAPPVLPLTGAAPLVNYLPYLLNVDKFHYSRSMQADLGTIDVQNISGDTIARTVAGNIISSVFENALFCLREWYAEGECAGRQSMGRISFNPVSETLATLNCSQLFNASAYEAPQYTYSETCGWRFGSIPCGADPTKPPCDNTFTTCLVPERFFGILNNFTQDLSPALADAARKLVNRAREL